MRSLISAVQVLDASAGGVAGKTITEQNLNSLARRARPFQVSYQDLDREHQVCELAGGQAQSRASATPMSKATPALATRGQTWAVLDGHLDNRRQLGRLLEVETTDANLALAAYLRWGQAFATRLIGHFSIILWDSTERRLVASRDPFGVRELFYRRLSHRLLVASQIWQLLDRPPSLADFDQEFFADFLASQVAVGEASPIRGIRRLLAGHTLVSDHRGIRTFQHWEISDARSDCRTALDYQEKFRELFCQAVGLSLEARGKVWAELSGGLDSSAIVCVAQHQRREFPSLAQGFGTLTLTWPESRESDESDWARIVANETGVDHLEIACEDAFFDQAERAATYRNEPHFGVLCFGMHQREVEILKSHRVDVLLSGSRAESVVLDNYAPFHLADHLRQWQLGKLWKQTASWANALSEPRLNVLYWYAIHPLLQPRSMDQGAERRSSLPGWLRPDFVEAMNLDARAGTRMPKRFASVAQQFQYELLGRSEQMIHRGYVDLAVEARYPFLYRPLVEHCFSTPWEIKHQPGRTKSLLREGLRDFLPAKTAARRGFTSPTFAAFRAYQRRWQSLQKLAENSLLGELGVVDEEAFFESLRLARFGRCDNFVALTSCMALEFWLRAQTSTPLVRAA